MLRRVGGGLLRVTNHTQLRVPKLEEAAMTRIDLPSGSLFHLGPFTKEMSVARGDIELPERCGAGNHHRCHSPRTPDVSQDKQRLTKISRTRSHLDGGPEVDPRDVHRLCVVDAHSHSHNGDRHNDHRHKKEGEQDHLLAQRKL